MLNIADIADADKPAFWCYQLVEELYANGLRHAIISPGSRSAPLAFAFDVHRGYTKTIILDERSAAFTALGIAKAGGSPAALVCTSGTAAANYFPAIVEARQSETPLLVLTADRPPKQRFTGSSQTIEQTKLYGDYPLFFYDAGEPVLQEEDLLRLRYIASQAAGTSRYPGGPVHINMPFRKPLEPGGKMLAMLEAESELQIKNNTPPIIKTIQPDYKTYLPEEVVSLMSESSRPVIIAGPRQAFHHGNDVITELSEKLNAPVLAESSSQVTGSSSTLIKGYDAFLRSPKTRNSLKPDLIVRFGNEPVSRGLENLMNDCSGIPHIHLFETGSPQNSSLALNYRSQVQLSSLVIPDMPTKTNTYLDSWKHHSRKYNKRLKEELDQADNLSDPHVYYDLVNQIPAGRNIIMSNSFPVRDFDSFGMLEGKDQCVFVNRGAAGIDGVTSTAIGCNAGNRNGGVLFTGDLAFLHDSNSLLQASQQEQPLLIIIVNNKGGSIFRMLPFENYDDRFTRLFETPQQINFDLLAKAHNINFKSVSTREELVPAFNELIDRVGISVLECLTDADESMNIRKNIW